MPKPFQRPPAPDVPQCENGKPLSGDGFCIAVECLWHVGRQRLIYEFVNLDAAAQKRVAGAAFYRPLIFSPVAYLLHEIQPLGKWAELWHAVRREGGDLGPTCPF